MILLVLTIYCYVFHQARCQDTISLDITPVDTDKEGEYICYKFPLDTFDEAYLADTTLDIPDHHIIHHAGVGFCEEPLSDTMAWKCKEKQKNDVIKTCRGAFTSLIGWKPPKDVGLALGRKTKYRYAIVEVHFGAKMKASSQRVARITLSLTQTKSKYGYQTHSLLSSGYIPANENRGYFTEVACPWKRPPAILYQYNAHTHGHGILVEGYLIRNGTWTLLGGPLIKGKVFDPTAFDLVSGPITLQHGDVLAARCLFRNDSPEPVAFGLDKEMCVMHYVFGYDRIYSDDFTVPLACVSNAQDFSFCNHEETSAICPQKSREPFM